MINAYHNPMVGGGYTAPMSGAPQTPSPEAANSLGVSASVAIDGTPTRVGAVAIVAILGLVAFKYGGVKFNIAT